MRIQSRTTFLAAHIGKRQDPYQLGLTHLAERMFEESTGRLALRILPQARGGDEAAVLRALCCGQLDLAVCSSVPLVPLIPSLNVLDLPFLFSSRAAAHRTFAGPGLVWARKVLRQAGLDLLAIFDGGERHLAVRPREVRHPADLRGLRLRTLDTPVHRALLEAWGAIPEHAPSRSLRAQLLAGSLDGVERSWSNLKELRLVEVAPHLTRVGHSVVPTYVLAGARVRAQVTPASWELLEVSATAAATREYEAYISADAVAVEALKISGIVPLEGDRMAFRRAAALVWTTFRKCPGIADALQAIGVTTP